MSAGNRSITRCGCTHPEACIDRHRGRYLTAVYWLSSHGDNRIRTGDVSTQVGVRPASVTGMFERLAAADLVEYQKHDGVTVTPHGETIAKELVRRRCIVQSFFESELAIELPEKTGYEIGFILPGEGIERLRKLTDVQPSTSCQPSGNETQTCPFDGNHC